MYIPTRHVTESRDMFYMVLDLSLSGVHTSGTFPSCGFHRFFPYPFTKRETWNKNQKHNKRTGEIGAEIKIRVCISSNYSSRHHKIYRIKKHI